MPAAKLGISTSALRDKHDLDGLLAFSPDVVEFYNYPSSSLPAISEFCARNHILPALHAPMPNDTPGSLTDFAPTDPQPEIFKETLTLALATVQCAANLKAVYVVVHFPSPRSPNGQQISDRIIRAFLDPLVEASMSHRVPVLLENLSSNLAFYTPEQYLAILVQYPTLGLCLDIGHAHLLAPTHTIEEFISTLNTRIVSSHIYNTTTARYAGFGHEFVADSQHKSAGWIDLINTIRLLRSTAKTEFFIMEPGAISVEKVPEAVSGARWLRDLLCS